MLNSEARCCRSLRYRYRKSGHGAVVVVTDAVVSLDGLLQEKNDMTSLEARQQQVAGMSVVRLDRPSRTYLHAGLHTGVFFR